MNQTVRKVAKRLRKRNSFEDLLNIYERDKAVVTLPARLAITAVASFAHTDAVTAELNVQQTRRVAAAQGPTTQWRPKVSPTILWVPLGDHRQPLAQEALVCQGRLVLLQGRTSTLPHSHFYAIRWWTASTWLRRRW